jgi:hypothetical protein
VSEHVLVAERPELELDGAIFLASTVALMVASSIMGTSPCPAVKVTGIRTSAMDGSV